MDFIFDKLQMLWLFSQQTTVLFVLSQVWLYILPFSQKMAVISTHWAGNCGANVPWRWTAFCHYRKFLCEVKKVSLTCTSKLRYPEYSYYSSSMSPLTQSVGHFKTINPCWSSPRTPLWLHNQQPSFVISLWLSWAFWLQEADSLHLVALMLQCRKFKHIELLSSSLRHSG